MDPIEYRSVIKFLVLRGEENTNILKQLSQAYGTECPSRTTVYFWIGEFRRGRTSVHDEERPGRPVEIDKENLEKRCEQLVKEERRLTIKELAKKLNIGVRKTQETLASLGIRKLSSRFVPRFLSAEMCEERLECCELNLDLWKEHGKQFLWNIVTVDETPLSLYLPETKRDSLEWRLKGETAPRKMRSGTSHRRALMLTIFWDCKGPIKVDYADKNTRINSEYYCDLIAETRSLRRKPRGLPLWLLQDNAPIHKSALSTTAINNAGFSIVPHPPYSPDLAPSDFWLFRHMKKAIRGIIFESAKDVKDAVTKFLRECDKKFYEDAFLELVHRWEKCVANSGGYIEK